MCYNVTKLLHSSLVGIYRGEGGHTEPSGLADPLENGEREACQWALEPGFKFDVSGQE